MSKTYTCIDIKSEADLPKEEGQYFTFDKTGNALNVFHFSKEYSDVWMNHVGSYLIADKASIESKKKAPCPNCKETVSHCACMRNICIRCGKPVGNITFSVCDDCWDKGIEPQKQEEGEWKLKSYSSQIADTGDYDGHYEITNGKGISLLTNDDDEESLIPILNALNNSGCKFYYDDSTEFELHLEKQETKRLKAEIELLSSSRHQGNDQQPATPVSAEEIIKPALLDWDNIDEQMEGIKFITRGKCIKAMEEYANQFRPVSVLTEEEINEQFPIDCADMILNSRGNEVKISQQVYLNDLMRAKREGAKWAISQVKPMTEGEKK